MGYYSQIAIAMFKDDFNKLLKESKERKNNEQIDTYWCLQNANGYYTDTYQDWFLDKDEKGVYKRTNIGNPTTVIILKWDWIRSGGTGMRHILSYIEQNGGGYARVGENEGDVETLCYDPPWNEDAYIPWTDYIETQSYVEVLGGGGDLKTLENLTEKINGTKTVSERGC